MRNLKKFLALVLSLMMTFSLMVTANAAIDTNAAVTDKDSITEEFKEAVAVLNGLKIITGYEDGTFRPDKSISRQEATALVYRLHSGDADNVKNNLYSTADNIAKFKDVNPNGAQQWSAGYIGYCANQEIIKGVGADRFNPTGNVTGYQMLAMVLRAIGYGQNGEYEGSGWQTRVATTATKLGMLKNIDDTNYAGTLSAPATRELVAEIVFQAALQGTVTYTPAFGYQEYGDASLGVQKFQLNCGNYTVIDKWGRPGYKWYSGSNPVATIKVNYAEAYDTTTRECDVAHDLKIDTSAKYRLFVNSDEFITDNYLIVATDTVTKVGGQGRITEFYDELHHPHKNNTWPASVVMIDTFLGKVTKVEDRVLDAKEHVMIPARLYVNVYDSVTNTEAGGTPVVLEKSDANWAFAKGDFITLNAYTNHDEGIDANDVKSVHTGPESNKNEAAFEAEKVLLKSGSKTPEYYANVAKVEPVLGKQTTIYWNQGKHNVDNVDKLDQLDLHLDVAGTTTDTTFAWYYDAKGNLIGIGNVPDNINYGIITSIYSSFKQGESSTTGEAVAIANVLYADGTKGTVTIDRFLMNSSGFNSAAGGHRGNDTDPVTGSMKDVSVTKYTTAWNTPGSTELLPVYDYSGDQPMQGKGSTADAHNAVQAGILYVAPVAAVNAASEKANTAATTPWGDTDSYGVICGNLFKFVNSADGNMTAIEVAGSNNQTTVADNNDGIYVGNYNALTNTPSELVKNYAYFTVRTGATGITIRMDNDTKIVVRGWDAANTKATDKVTVYDGIDELPANIVVPDDTEVDWADTDNNGIADVVYVYGVKKGATGYGLFYYNGGAGQWTGNAATGSGWLRGWLDGKETDLTFNDKDLFDRVQLSTNIYGGHLFAMKLTDGEVDELLGSALNARNQDMDYFLIDDVAPVAGPPADNKIAPNATAVALKDLKLGTFGNVSNGLTAASGSAFQFGTDNGNDYTITGKGETSAIWLHDDPANKNNGSYTDVVYNNSNNTIEVWKYRVTAGVASNKTLAPANVYNLSGTSAQLGDALYFLNMAGRVNDVTLVFEAEANNTIRQVYVTTRPDITPPSQGGSTVVSVTKPGAGVTDISGNTGITNETQLDTALKGLPTGTVVYNKNHLANATWTSSAPEDVLYFAFNASATSQAVTLKINELDGTLRYYESGTSTAAGGGYFGVNVNPDVSTAGDAHWFMGVGLKPGTYSFTITVNGVPTTGTFTMD